MALQRSQATSSLLNVGRQDGTVPIAKRVLVKGNTTAHQRAALGNISNKTTVTGVKTDGVKSLKASEDVKPLKNLRHADQKQKPVTRKDTLQQVTEEPVPPATQDKESVGPRQIAVVVPYVELKTEDVAMTAEAPMDTSTTSTHDCDAEAFSRHMWKLNINDIDRDDAENPQLVSEYVNDIYEYMRELERTYPIRPHCLANQADINGRMRGILIDWLVQVHLRFHLLQETLFLTVAILDRYLQTENVTKNRLQLVGVTSMWIAAKYEEMYAPEVADFVYITDNAYSKSDIRQMEFHILKTLDFQLGRPLAIHFLRRNSKAGEVDATTHTMAKYLMELTLVDYDLVHCPPSEIAAAALCLSMKLLTQASWSATLAHYSCYSSAQLQPLISKLAHLAVHAGTGKLVAIKAKYQSSKFMRISKSEELSSAIVQELSTGACS